ncbi:OpgC domain-containing protein [Aurantimonas sp. Leaf443]|uniref:OpgC family protein n=1 Tax=Aurantimonas sp. Leaf443 TaxID=1736378 RepID=UPI000700A5E0|nr:OpgC domain-containing protein [Aurantimonas sp. Leaf443]KQT88458.1 hypothetical protein ASG48_03340 [Aurantimonas sp. Leaf443]
MKRLDVIDGLRGYFLVFMLINHLAFDGGYWLVEINHRQLAFVEDAQGFVFLSGLLVGMVYAGRMARRGFRAAAAGVWTRAGDLYRQTLGLLAFAMTLALLVPAARLAWVDWMGDLDWRNPFRAASAALLLFQPTYMDILPQYIVYMLAAPFLIRACLRGHWQAVLIGSSLLWLAAQFGVQRPLTAPFNTWLAGDTGHGLRVNFNLMAWQVVFVFGLVFGTLTATNRIDWTRVFRPDSTFIPVAALSVCLFFLPFRFATAHDYMPIDIMGTFQSYENRSEFGLVYLLNFAAVASGIAWLLIAGPDHASPRVRGVSSALSCLFRLPFLRLLGRHSLQVYAWHVVIVYLVRFVDFETPRFNQPLKTAIALACIALLSLPALYRERDRFFGAGPGPRAA